MLSYFCRMARKNRKQVFTNLEVIDAGAKGKTVAKAPDGKVVFLSNAVPGDVVLIAGKGHETYQEISRVFYDYNERVVTREIVAELEKKNVCA